MESQLAALRAILEVASDTPRLLSVHSYRATGLVARELREFRPHAAILHWWLGSPEETEAAVAAGTYFSVNASQARSWKSLRLVPADRLLLETDHPFGDRSESPPRRPGNLARSETAVSTALSMSPDALRRRTWSNLKAIAETLNLVEMFPPGLPGPASRRLTEPSLLALAASYLGSVSRSQPATTVQQAVIELPEQMPLGRAISVRPGSASPSTAWASSGNQSGTLHMLPAPAAP
jgi:TatD DNase family protein